MDNPSRAFPARRPKFSILIALSRNRAYALVANASLAAIFTPGPMVEESAIFFT